MIPARVGGHAFARAPLAYKARAEYASGMRTTLDIPDELMERARRAAALPSKRDTVLAGLAELIRKAEREELRAMAGKADLRVDLRRSRSGKR